MRKLILSTLLVCASMWAQTAVYPNAVVTDSQLKVAYNVLQTTLTASQAATDTILIVQSTANFAPNMLVTVGTEIENICGVSGSNILQVGVSSCPNVDGRGFDTAHGGTAAAAHSSGSAVARYVTAWDENAKNKELEAIESTLGANLSNVSKVPMLNAGTYAFGPITSGAGVSVSGGALVNGDNTLTFTVVPAGVNGTDSNHYLYFSGGTGGPQPCLITGGSGTAGQANGQVIVNCTSSQSGAWTVQSTLGGIPEAVQAASTAGGGTVLIPEGTFTAYAHLAVPSKVRLQGMGPGSVVQLAAGAWPTTATASNPFWCNNLNVDCLVGTTDGASGVVIEQLVVDMNGANNSNTTNGDDIVLWDCTDCTVTNVKVKNAHHGGAAMASLYGAGTAKNNLFFGNKVYGYGSANSGGLPTCTGGIFAQGLGDRIINNYAEGLCDAAFIANGQVGNPSTQICDVAVDGNYWQYGTSSATLLGGAFSDESCGHAKFVNNTCAGEANEGCFFIDVTQVAQSITDATVSANRTTMTSANNAPASLTLYTDGTHLVQNVIVEGNNFNGSGVSLLNSGAGSSGISNVRILGNQINGAYNTGIFVNNGANHIQISGNTVQGTAAGYGVNIFSSSVSDISVLNNLIYGDSGQDIIDSSGAAKIAGNVTDGAWNGVSDIDPVAPSAITLSNGANENIASAVSGITPMQTALTIVGPTSSFSLGGFAGCASGRILSLFNSSGQAMTVTNGDSGSSAGNRISTPGGSSLTNVNSVVLYCNPAIGHWSVVSAQ